MLARAEFGPADPAAVTTLDASTHFDPESLAQTVDLARTVRTQILWGRTYASITLGGLGLLAIAIGAAMLVRGRRSQDAGTESGLAAGESVTDDDAHSLPAAPVSDLVTKVSRL